MTIRNHLQLQDHHLTIWHFYLNIEKLLDKIADALIESEVIDPTRVLENQKFIRDGVIKFGATENTAESMALYQKDIEANIEDIGFDINNL